MGITPLGYKLKVIKNASFKKFTAELQTAHEESKKSKLAITVDMARSLVKYGAGYYDYVNFKFFDLTDQQRSTYFTRFRSKKLIAQVNDPQFAGIFDSKSVFNKVFSDFIKRGYISLQDAADGDLEEFYNKHDDYFAKMEDLEAGAGAELLHKKDFPAASDFIAYVRSKKFGLIEQVLKNHPQLAEVYDESLNTMRMITLIDDKGEPHLLFAAQKFGVNGRNVDVYGAHGPVDLTTGAFLYPARYGVIKENISFTEHPNTGVPLVGHITPMFQEAKQMVLSAARVVPQMRYVGWDVAITPNGPAIIEGNNYSAHDYWQLPGQNPDKIGVMPMLKQLVPSVKF